MHNHRSSLKPTWFSLVQGGHPRRTSEFYEYRRFVRERATMARNRSTKQLVSPAVDFQRIWSDRDARGATREGISIWRPNPPPSYCSLGERPCRPALCTCCKNSAVARMHLFEPQNRSYSMWTTAAGDCITRGFDPPRDTTVVRDVDPVVLGTNSIPQLRPPRSYQLVWADESVRPEKALSIWMPLPPSWVRLPAATAEQAPARLHKQI